MKTRIHKSPNTLTIVTSVVPNSQPWCGEEIEAKGYAPTYGAKGGDPIEVTVGCSGDGDHMDLSSISHQEEGHEVAVRAILERMESVGMFGDDDVVHISLNGKFSVELFSDEFLEGWRLVPSNVKPEVSRPDLCGEEKAGLAESFIWTISIETKES